jgi:hypothetical protein
LIARTLRLAAAFLLPASVALADVIPADGTFLTGLTSTQFRFIDDGTSNTILLTETTQLAVCLDHVGFGDGGIGSITDGTSNTLLLGGNSRLGLTAGRVLSRRPISTITDGSSNTIIIGEPPPSGDSLCFDDQTRPRDVGQITDGTSNTIQFGEESSFDVCFRSVRVGTIADGTSNTIVFGEVVNTPVCFDDVRVAVDPLAAPEPQNLPLLVLALLGAVAWQRWNFDRRD